MMFCLRYLKHVKNDDTVVEHAKKKQSKLSSYLGMIKLKEFIEAGHQVLNDHLVTVQMSVSI